MGIGAAMGKRPIVQRGRGGLGKGWVLGWQLAGSVDRP